MLVERLVRMANEAGGGDNIAAVVLSFQVSATPVDDGLPELALRLDSEPDAGPAFDAGVSAAAPPPRREQVSAPEILLLGIESDVDPEEAHGFRVVPAESATSGLFRALGDILPKQRPSRPPAAACVACHEALAPEGVFCPKCGVRQPARG